MASFKHITDGSTTVLNFVRQARGRRRTIVIAAVAIVVALAGGGVLLSRQLGASASARLGESWAALQRCLIGEPLKDGESAAARFRHIQIAALASYEFERAAKKADVWPDRCSRHAYVLKEALQSAGSDGSRKELAQWAEKLGGQLEQKQLAWREIIDAVGNTWEHASKSALPPGSAEQVPEPPPPVPATTVDELAKQSLVVDKAVDLKNARTELHPGPAALVVVDQAGAPRAPFLCRFTADDAQCLELPKGQAGNTRAGLHLLGTADEGIAPLVFAGTDGSDGIFQADGSLTLEGTNSRGGFVAKDGFAAVLEWDAQGRTLKLLRKAGDAIGSQPLFTGALRLDNPADDARLFWNQLVVRGKSGTETVLAMAEVKPLGPPGPMAAAGPLEAQAGGRAGAASPISGCRAGDVIVVRAHNAGNDWVSFFEGGKWSKPVKAKVPGGTLGCSAEEATLIRVDPGSEGGTLETNITFQRCTPAACGAQRFQLGEALRHARALAPATLGVMSVASLQGKLLLVWRAGEDGGVRMRLGPADQLGSATDVVLYDDLVSAGAVQKTSTLVDLRVLARDDFAIVLLATTAGVHALRVTPDGKHAPVKVPWP